MAYNKPISTTHKHFCMQTRAVENNLSSKSLVGLYVQHWSEQVHDLAEEFSLFLDLQNSPNFDANDSRYRYLPSESNESIQRCYRYIALKARTYIKSRYQIVCMLYCRLACTE